MGGYRRLWQALFSFPTPFTSLCVRLTPLYIQAPGQKAHVLTSHRLLVGWRLCSDLEPDLKGKWAQVCEAAWLHSPKWLSIRPHVPQPQARTHIHASELESIVSCRHIWCYSGLRCRYVIFWEYSALSASTLWKSGMIESDVTSSCPQPVLSVTQNT